jgi:hypothetical protein
MIGASLGFWLLELGAYFSSRSYGRVTQLPKECDQEGNCAPTGIVGSEI